MPNLPANQLDGVRILSQEGCREHTIRRAMGLTPVQWKRLRDDGEDGELSPLALALEEGRAEGAGEIISFMRTRMIGDKDVRAAQWLAEHVFKVTKPSDDDTAPRVLIQINPALSVEEYRRGLTIEHD